LCYIKITIPLYDQPSITADTITHIKTEDMRMCLLDGASTDLRGGEICAGSNGAIEMGRGNPNNVIQILIIYHKSHMKSPCFKLRNRCKNYEPHTLS
jgi:hypothetical protein